MTNLTVKCVVCGDAQTGRLKVCRRCGRLFHFPTCGSTPFHRVRREPDKEDWRDGESFESRRTRLVEDAEGSACGVCLGWDSDRIAALASPELNNRSAKLADKRSRLQGQKQALALIQELNADRIRSSERLLSISTTIAQYQARRTMLETDLSEQVVKLYSLRQLWVQLDGYGRNGKLDLDEASSDLVRRLIRRVEPGVILWGDRSIPPGVVRSALTQVETEGKLLRQGIEKSDIEIRSLLKKISDLENEATGIQDRLQNELGK